MSATEIDEATDTLERIAAAKAAQVDSQPVESVEIHDDGTTLGQVQRGSGGMFCLKLLTVTDASNVDVGADGQIKVKKPKLCREVRVPMHMERTMWWSQIKRDGQTYQILAPSDVPVAKPREERYKSERVRDNVLGNQSAYLCDVDDVGNVSVGDRVRFNLGPPDWKRINEGGGGTWLGAAGLNTKVF